MTEHRTTMTPEFEQMLGKYLASRDQQRLDTVSAMLLNLTERERRLVGEAAVMGWVQGVRHHDVAIPKTREIVTTVLDAATAFSDLYPTLAALEPGFVPPEGEDDD